MDGGEILTNYMPFKHGVTVTDCERKMVGENFRVSGGARFQSESESERGRGLSIGCSHVPTRSPPPQKNPRHLALSLSFSFFLCSRLTINLA